jgi:DNA anti-recombination protein RmuC
MNSNKLQNETKIIKRKESERERAGEKERDEIKKKAKDIKEEFNRDMKELRKKKETEILNIKSLLNQIKDTVESHSSRLEQVEDRISEL